MTFKFIETVTTKRETEFSEIDIMLLFRCWLDTQQLLEFKTSGNVIAQFLSGADCGGVIEFKDSDIARESIIKHLEPVLSRYIRNKQNKV